MVPQTRKGFGRGLQGLKNGLDIKGDLEGMGDLKGLGHWSRVLVGNLGWLGNLLALANQKDGGKDLVGPVTKLGGTPARTQVKLRQGG